MANYGDGQNFWDGQGQSQNQDFNFEMPDQFGQELWDFHQSSDGPEMILVLTFLLRNFQNFDNAAQAPAAVTHDHNPYANVPPAQYGGSFLDASQTSSNMYGQADFGQQKAYTGNEFDDEPPLLEGMQV